MGAIFGKWTYFRYEENGENDGGENVYQATKNRSISIQESIQCNGEDDHHGDDHSGEINNDCNVFWIIEGFNDNFSCLES